MNSRFTYRFLILAISFIGLRGTTVSGQSLFKSSNNVTGPYEVSIGFTQVPIYPNDAAFVKTRGIGLTIRTGIRPEFAKRRLLLETFFQHISKSRDKTNPVYHDRNPFNLFGISASYLILNPEMRINPFVGVGYGIYVFRPMIFFNPDYACSASQGCPAYFYKKKTFQTLTLNSGFYVMIIPDLAFRGGITLFRRIGSGFSNT